MEYAIQSTKYAKDEKSTIHNSITEKWPVCMQSEVMCTGMTLVSTLVYVSVYMYGVRNQCKL